MTKGKEKSRPKWDLNSKVPKSECIVYHTKGRARKSRNNTLLVCPSHK